MKNIDLHEKFIEALINKIPKRADLVTAISDILKIERESATRRLSGKVLFTVKEVGILSQELQISIDNLLNKDKDYIIIPMKMDMPSTIESFDFLINQIEGHLQLQRSLYEEPSEVGIVFDSIPLEFSGQYKYIEKFIFFKWGHYFVGSREFDDFSSWEFPDKLQNITKEIINICDQYTSIYYIWDISVIWNFVKEIRHFYDMHIVNDEDLALIKNELYDFLNYMEEVARGVTLNKRQKIDLYISNVNIGMYGYYHFSANNRFTFMKNYFIQSAASQDYIISNKLREWVDEMKKVSTLISGSGAKARKLFFEEQRSIVDTL